MASQTKSAGTIVNENWSEGSVAWSNPANAAADDNNYATAMVSVAAGDVLSPSYATSHYLKATNFGFSLPANAEIVGIQAKFHAKASMRDVYTEVDTLRLYILKNGTPAAHQNTPYLETAEKVYSLGSSLSLWGETWAASDINNSNFGAKLYAFYTNRKSSPVSITAYVDYIEITVHYNLPNPTPPTGLTRANFNAAQAASFSWTFNDPNPGDTQGAYQLQIIDAEDGSVDYDSGKVTSSTASMTLTAATLANGKQYQWRVKTWDAADNEGSYSNLATFFTSAAPVAAITSPATDGAEVSTSTLTVGWSFTDVGDAQSAYRAELLDATDTVLEDSGKTTSTGTSCAFTYPLESAVNYKVRITLWDSFDIASVAVVRTFTVAFIGPPKPSISFSTDDTRGSIGVVTANPTSVTNLVSNPSFESDLASYTMQGEDVFSISSDALYGSKAAHAVDTSNSTNGYRYQNLIIPNGHLTYVAIDYKLVSGVGTLLVFKGDISSTLYDLSLNQIGGWTLASAVVTVAGGGLRITFGVSTSNVGDILFDGLRVIDLTAKYGAGNEPDKAWCDANISYETTEYPSFSHNDIYRKKSTESAYTRIATGIAENATYIDYTPASGETYTYKVRAVAENTGYMDSDPDTIGITLTKAQITRVDEYDNPIMLKVRNKSSNLSVEKAMMQFEGRVKPVVEFGEHEYKTINLTVLADTIPEADALKKMLLSRQIILYRDERGRRVFATLSGGVNETDEQPEGSILSFVLEETDYTEDQ